MSGVREHHIAAIIAVAAAAVFIFQACPTFYFWDSAELTAAVAGKGVPHPPGFPLYLIAATAVSLVVPLKAATYLPLFSSILAAVAIGVIYLAMVRFAGRLNFNRSESRLAALFGSLILCLSYSITAQATRAEVYALQMLIYAAFFLLSADLIFADDSLKNGLRKISIIYLLIGLGLANHILTAAMLLPATVWLTYKKMNAKRLALSALSLIIPFTAYFYLMLLARSSPTQNWGDPATIDRLIKVITAAEFDKSAAAFALPHIYENTSFAVNLIYRQLGPIFSAMAILGLLSAAMRDRRSFGFFILILLGNIMSTIFNEIYYYENLDIHGYLTAGLISAAFFGIRGLLTAGRYFSGRIKSAVILLIGTAGVIIGAVPHLGKASLSGDVSAERLARTLAAECDTGAILFCSSYNTFFIIQALQAEQYRTDIRLIHVYQLERDWYRNQLLKRFNLQPARAGDSAPAFYRQLINSFKDSCEILVEYDEFSAPLRNYLWPEGFLWKFKSAQFHPNEVNEAWSPDKDLAGFENYLKSGTDYEELKSMAWMLRNRMQFFADLGYVDLANSYLAEVDRLAAAFAKNVSKSRGD